MRKKINPLVEVTYPKHTESLVNILHGIRSGKYYRRSFEKNGLSGAFGLKKMALSPDRVPFPVEPFFWPRVFVVPDDATGKLERYRGKTFRAFTTAHTKAGKIILFFREV